MSRLIVSEAPASVFELAVISGKGGTGKTSIVASFAVLADNAVLADCDVDAADLHLVLSPEVKRRVDFYSGHLAVIRKDDCLGCGECLARCRFEAVCVNGSGNANAPFWIDPIACEGCGTCVRFCPEQAIDFPERHSGEWFVSETRRGPMVYGRLGLAQANSGKLVSTVRRQAKLVAEERRRRLIIIDGPPGIGCPVIASVTGASLVLVVTEPTVAGEHDLDRVLRLTKHFGIPAAVCVNKWDLNPTVTERVEVKARERGAAIAGRVRYDRGVTAAQLHAKATVELDCEAAADIRALWRDLCDIGVAYGTAL